MKNRAFNAFLLLAMVGMMFTACKKEYPEPPIQDLPIGTVYTISEILAMESGTVFTDDASVYGIVTADEQSGNLYKAAFIQERATGAALELHLNAVSGLRIGDSIRVYLKDVTYSLYNNLPQLSNFEADGHIIILANNKPIEPTLTTIANINAGQHRAGLVKLENVYFASTGTFADPTTYGNRTLRDDSNNEVIVRTSNYANFANDSLPQGTGNLVAIASVYNNTWQLLIRSAKELEFDGFNPGGGALPGEVHPLPYYQSFSNEFGSYMTYSVVDDDHFWKIDYNSAVMTGHVKIGDEHYYYTNEDWLISSPVEITGVDHAKAVMSYAAQYNGPSDRDVTMQVSADYIWGTDPSNATWRELPNTFSNSSGWNFQMVEVGLDDFLGQTVTVAVKFVSSDTQSRTFEISSISIQEGQAGDVPEPPTPGQGEGTGTFDDPYNVAAGIGLQSEKPTAWVQGYIVGAVKSGPSSVSTNDDIDWAAPFSRATNVLIADDPNCNEVSNCIIVELVPSSSPLRAQVNLVDNPQNLGKTLAVLGKLRTYFGQSGLRDSAGTEEDFVLEGGDTPTPPDPGTGIFSETFANGQGQFTIQDVELAGLSYVWNYMTNYHCMKANGYYQGAHATESWLVSPQIDMTSVSTATLTFEHALNFADGEGVLSVQASTNYTGDVTTATWTELPIDVWPEQSSSFPFVTATIEMSAFAGQTVTIAFRYNSTTGQCPAWEVKNVVVE